MHATALGAGRYASAHTDECIVPYRRVVGRIRAHGAAVFGQLYHPGRGDIAGSSDDGSVSVAYAPSALASERTSYQLTPRPMVARPDPGGGRRLRRRGGAHARGGIPGDRGDGPPRASGLAVPSTPASNRRGDGYGGSASARLRFLREILETVRSRIRDDMPLGLRICADEMDDVGLRPAEALSVCRSIDRSGLADYLSINLGSTSSFRGGVHVTAPMAFAPGYIAPHARAIRSAVDLPVLATGRINEPRIAGAPPRGRCGRSVRHDPGADLRSGTRGQGARGPQRCDPGVYRLQPGLHRSRGQGGADLVHPVPRERGASRPACRARAPPGGSGCSWREAGRRGLKAAAVAGRVRPPRGALRGEGAARRTGAHRRPAPRTERVRRGWRRISRAKRGAQGWRSSPAGR